MFLGTFRPLSLKYFLEKGAWPGSRDPLNFWALNTYSSKMVKATDSNFMHMFLGTFRPLSFKYFLEKGAWPGSRDPQIFLALNAYSSKTVKAMDFKFDKRVSSILNRC